MKHAVPASSAAADSILSVSPPPPPTPESQTAFPLHPLDAPAIRAFCLRVLAHLQTARGWTRTPDVLYLDFPPKV